MKKPFILVFLIPVVLFGACKPKVSSHENPLLASWGGDFGLPPFDRIKTAHYLPAFEEAIRQHEHELREMAENKQKPSFENVILAFDRSGELLRRITGVYELIGSAGTDEEFEALKEQAEVKLAEHYSAVCQDETLFAKVQSVYDFRTNAGLSDVQKGLVEHIYGRFVEGGALLSAQDRETMRRIDRELAEKQTIYSRNLMLATKNSYVVADSSQIDGLPFALKDTTAKLARAAGMGGKFVFIFDDPVISQTLTLAADTALRNNIYEAYVGRCSSGGENDNREVMAEIVRLREEKARLLGFGSYGEFSLSHRMAANTRAAYSFLDEVWKNSGDKTAGELAAMDKKLNKKGGPVVRPCDVMFYSNRVLRADMNVDREMMNVYFSVDNVRSGAFELANRLFGVTFRPVQPALYNSDCEAYEVFDIDNSRLGLFIMDYFPRSGKKNGAWIQTFDTDGSAGNGKGGAVGLMFNFMRSNSGRPAMLSFEEVEILFRKVGDALACLLVDVPYEGLEQADPGLAGILGSLMSRWAFERQTLIRYAVHYSTGKLMADNQINNIVKSRRMDKGGRTVTRAASAYLDLDAHTAKAAELTTPEAFERERLREKRNMPEFLDPVYRLTDFGQVFGGQFAAGYYEGLWADALAADVYDMFVRDGDIYDREVAGQLREKVLSKGGSYPAAGLFRDFRGRDMSVEAFLVSAGFVEPPPAPEVRIPDAGPETELESEATPEREN